jgi:hypothetical protein
MPNPRANRPLTLDQVTADLKSLSQPAQALFDMMAGGLRGSAVGTLGAPGDIETLARMGVNAAGGSFNPAMPSRSGRAFQPVSEEPFFPSSEELAKRFPPTIPNGDPMRRKSAEPFEEIGQFAPLPLSGKALKVLPYALGRGAGEATKMTGQALSDAMIHQTGPLSQGPLSMLAPKGAVSHVIKPKGGNWLGGGMKGASVGDVDQKLKALKTYAAPENREAELLAEIDEATRMGAQGYLNAATADLDRYRKSKAVDNWIERNVGNYIKKEMATPEDPVRLMFEKRAQEIEAQFQTDMNRAQRTRARAEAETDPRRQANLTRQAAQQEEQAKFDRDFATEHITHLPKDEWGELSNPSEELMQKRLREGFQGVGEAKSDPAQRWENLTDEAVGINRAGDVQDQKNAMIKAQDTERAFLNKDDEINDTFRPRLIEILAQRGEKLSDKDIDALVKITPTSQKATILGERETWSDLRNQAQQARIDVNSGLWDAYNKNKWVDKLDPEANVYSAYIGDLGIDHVVDVIKQDVAAGRIRPEQLNKLSMDQAIQRTAEFNMEQAKKMRDTAIKQTEGMPTHKEYADEGYKWIELRQPEAKLEEGHYIVQDKPSASNWKVVPHPDGEGYALRADNGQMALDGGGITERKWNSPQEARGSIAEYAEIQEPDADALFRVVDQSGNTISVGATEKEALKLYKRQERDQQLADALKYEGDTMGHCVGGYCPDVLEGRSRIYSLRDKRGEPHVTIEVQPMRGSELGRYAAELPEGEDVAAMKNPPMRITQIKGKGNARPVEKYDPYTQDFVRGGNWSQVGDLHNTGLFQINKDFLGGLADFMPQAEDIKHLKKQQRMEALAKAMDAGDLQPGYATRNEWEEAIRKHGSPTIGEADDELLRQLQPPEDGMKRGGSVHISDNPDTMMMELGDQHFALGGAALKMARANKARQAAQAAEKELALPPKLPRAKPRSKEELRPLAQEMAEATRGDFYRPEPSKSFNPAGKSFEQWKTEQGLVHDIRPTAKRQNIPRADIEKQKGMVKMGISGDTTAAEQVLHEAGPYALDIPSPQHGGALYGLGGEGAWASNNPIAANVQKRINEISQAYGDAPVLGQYMQMGKLGSDFALHFADANLRAIDLGKMSKDQVEMVNELIRRGSPKSGPRPSFPGIEDKDSAYLHFAVDPELRKHFNAIMQKPTYTEPLGLPDGRIIHHAITEPELRDLPVTTTGFSQMELAPGYDPEKLLLSEHPTYSHVIPNKPGTGLTRTQYHTPAQVEFPDVYEYLTETAPKKSRPQDMTRMYQTSSPRQIIDQQHIDEIKMFEELMKQYGGKKEGGAITVKPKKGGQKFKPGKKSDPVLKHGQAVPLGKNQEVDLSQIMPMMAGGGEVNADDLILEERPL